MGEFCWFVIVVFYFLVMHFSLPVFINPTRITADVKCVTSGDFKVSFFVGTEGVCTVDYCVIKGDRLTIRSVCFVVVS